MPFELGRSVFEAIPISFEVCDTLVFGFKVGLEDRDSVLKGLELLES
ncbi:hypothetical protein [Natrarchaeobius oligotrophus]|nr:hypothetical protein [Natrarchaeobius chitinivorans]